MIPYGRQHITQADIDAVVAVLQSDFLTQGPKVPLFEEIVCTKVDVKHALAVNSATSALHIACLALGLGQNDWLWTTPVTFVASANCGQYCGASVDFVDIDPHTYNLSPEALETKLLTAEREGKLPKVLVAVHLCGQPCEMRQVHALSQRFGFKIIEDASHAIGARYGNIKVGSCTHSDISVFSFHPVKIITTGEGGMAMTNDEALASRLRRLRSHGITNDKALMQPRPDNEIWNYQQIELGFNYRMTDIQAALGLSQMTHLDEFVQRRHQIAERYDEALKTLPIVIPWRAADTYSSYHLYPARVNEAESRKSQRQVYDMLWQEGVAANLHYIPVHRQPYYENKGFKAGVFSEAESFHREVISLPMFPAVSIAQQNSVIGSLKRIFQ